MLFRSECAKICELKTDSVFRKHVEEKVILEHEKAIFMNYCRESGFNDHGRIVFLEEYTGLKLK